MELDIKDILYTDGCANLNHMLSPDGIYCECLLCGCSFGVDFERNVKYCPGCGINFKELEADVEIKQELLSVERGSY